MSATARDQEDVRVVGCVRVLVNGCNEVVVIGCQVERLTHSVVKEADRNVIDGRRFINNNLTAWSSPALKPWGWM